MGPLERVLIIESLFMYRRLLEFIISRQKMPEYQLSLRAYDEPIIIIYGSRLPNDEAQKYD